MTPRSGILSNVEDSGEMIVEAILNTTTTLLFELLSAATANEAVLL